LETKNLHKSEKKFLCEANTYLNTKTWNKTDKSEYLYFVNRSCIGNYDNNVQQTN